jgi:hypothetical protein
VWIARGALLVLALLSAAACGAAPAPAPAQVASDPDVVALLPRDATSVIVASPRVLFEAPASRLLLTRLVPDARLEALRVQHGVDVRSLEQVVVASYEDGDIYVLRGPFLAHVAVAEMGHRMVPVESRVDAPRARVGGIFRGTRVDAIAIGPHTLAIVAGPPSLSGRLLATLDGTDRSFDAHELRAAVSASPFVWLRPVPLVLPIDAPIAILLARERSLSVTAAPDPDGAGTIALSVRFVGEFPPGADANFRQLAASLAQTDLGRAVGMPAALASLTVEARASEVLLGAHVGAEGLARGLWLAMGAEIEEALAEASDDPSSGL